MATKSAKQIPLAVQACRVWQRQASPDVAVRLDGTLPLSFGQIPEILVGWPDSLADGYPGRVTYHFTLPRATILRAIVNDMGKPRAGVRCMLDGHVAAEGSWSATDPRRPQPDAPVTLAFPVPAGPHTLVVENPGNTDWISVASVDFGLPTSVLGAIGRRNGRVIAAWVWNRQNLFAPQPGPAAAGTLLLKHVPPGRWTVTWWDTETGEPGRPIRVRQTARAPDGELDLPIPPVVRSAAVVLRR